MAERPTYLDRLNALALAERGSATFLGAWAKATNDREVKHIMSVVSTREAEHSLALIKRIQELGFELEEQADPRLEEQLAITSSDKSDFEKFQALGYTSFPSDGGGPQFDNIFLDHTIDPQTGALLGRFVAEEHDSARMFKALYERLLTKSDATA